MLGKIETRKRTRSAKGAALDELCAKRVAKKSPKTAGEAKEKDKTKVKVNRRIVFNENENEHREKQVNNNATKTVPSKGRIEKLPKKIIDP